MNDFNVEPVQETSYEHISLMPKAEITVAYVGMIRANGALQKKLEEAEKELAELRPIKKAFEFIIRGWGFDNE